MTEGNPSSTAHDGHTDITVEVVPPPVYGGAMGEAWAGAANHLQEWLTHHPEALTDPGARMDFVTGWAQRQMLGSFALSLSKGSNNQFQSMKQWIWNNNNFMQGQLPFATTAQDPSLLQTGSSRSTDMLPYMMSVVGSRKRRGRKRTPTKESLRRIGTHQGLYPPLQISRREAARRRAASPEGYTTRYRETTARRSLNYSYPSYSAPQQYHRTSYIPGFTSSSSNSRMLSSLPSGYRMRSSSYSKKKSHGMKRKRSYGSRKSYRATIAPNVLAAPVRQITKSRGTGTTYVANREFIGDLIQGATATPAPLVSINSSFEVIGNSPTAFTKGVGFRGQIGGTAGTNAEADGRYHEGNANPKLINGLILPCNPGTLSPWLSKIAANFDGYKFKKLIFHYRSLSGTALGTGVTGLGLVLMGCQYDVQDIFFNKKTNMEQQGGTLSCPPYQNMSLDVLGGAGKENQPYKYRWIRKSAAVATTANVTAHGDARLTDTANFTLAFDGIPPLAAGFTVDTQQKLGELWVEYEVELYKPVSLETNPGATIYSWRNASANNATPLTNITVRPNFLGTDEPQTFTHDTVSNIIISAGGYYHLTWQFEGIAGSGGTIAADPTLNFVAPTTAVRLPVLIDNGLPGVPTGQRSYNSGAAVGPLAKGGLNAIFWAPEGTICVLAMTTAAFGAGEINHNLSLGGAGFYQSLV